MIFTAHIFQTCVFQYIVGQMAGWMVGQFSYKHDNFEVFQDNVNTNFFYNDIIGYIIGYISLCRNKTNIIINKSQRIHYILYLYLQEIYKYFVNFCIQYILHLRLFVRKTKDLIDLTIGEYWKKCIMFLMFFMAYCIIIFIVCYIEIVF